MSRRLLKHYACYGSGILVSFRRAVSQFDSTEPTDCLLVQQNFDTQLSTCYATVMPTARKNALIGCTAAAASAHEGALKVLVEGGDGNNEVKLMIAWKP